MAKAKKEGKLIAKARDDFFRCEPNLLEGNPSGQYLKNRLEIAFIAGWHAAKKPVTHKTKKKRSL